MNPSEETVVPRTPSDIEWKLRGALNYMLDCTEWYVRCLSDINAQLPVRGLPEAEAAYERATREARELLNSLIPGLSREGG